MKNDAVDDILGQWSSERPELDTASLGVVIRVMALNKLFAREAAAALDRLGIELFEYDVLSALRRQGKPYALPATGLARETGLSSGAMTNRIDRLESKGLVRRQTDAADRRCVVVALTDAGKKLIDEAIQFRLDVADEGLRSVSREELAALAALLRKVCLSNSL
jgi:DNA-binding MarR family transcriptional regulator